MDWLNVFSTIPLAGAPRFFPRTVVRPVAAAAIIVMAAMRTFAMAHASSPIATDRLAVTDSSIVVPAGSLQVENGFTGTGDPSVLDGPESLFRFGVASRTELRLTAPDYFNQSSGPSGFGDLEVGMKQQLGPMYEQFLTSTVRILKDARSAKPLKLRAGVMNGALEVRLPRRKREAGRDIFIYTLGTCGC